MGSVNEMPVNLIQRKKNYGINEIIIKLTVMSCKYYFQGKKIMFAIISHYSKLSFSRASVVTYSRISGDYYNLIYRLFF